MSLVKAHLESLVASVIILDQVLKQPGLASDQLYAFVDRAGFGLEFPLYLIATKIIASPLILFRLCLDI